MMKRIDGKADRQPSIHTVPRRAGWPAMAKQTPGQRLLPHDTLALRFGSQGDPAETQFLEAAKSGNVEAVAAFLKQAGFHAVVRDAEGKSALDWAVLNDQLGAVKEILKARHQLGRDYLHTALKSTRMGKRTSWEPASPVETCDQIYDAIRQSFDNLGYAAEGHPVRLFNALQYDELDAVQDHLLAGKIDLNTRLHNDYSDEYALFGRDLSLLEYAVHVNSAESVEAFLSAGREIGFDSIDFALLLAKSRAIYTLSRDPQKQADFHSKAVRCLTLLEQARKDRIQALPSASRDYIAAAETGKQTEMLARQSDISLDAYGTALAGAAAKGQAASINALLRHPYAKQLPDLSDILNHAAFEGHLSLVEAMLVHHSDRLNMNHLLQAASIARRAPHQAVQSALRQAIQTRHASFLQFLRAAKAGDTDYIRQILANPDDINIVDYVNLPNRYPGQRSSLFSKDPPAALISVAGQGNIPALTLLLAYKTQMLSYLPEHALAAAVRRKQHEAVSKLIAAGVKVPKYDSDLLQDACANNDLKMMDILLKAGASADVYGERWGFGSTEGTSVYLLELELQQKRYDTALKLLGAGAKLHKVPRRDYGPLLRHLIRRTFS